ncbi:hypothetical protein RJT34_32585 [Clitoria ternatea]|uniref:Uncharacterized protein n=1 Tax=Clitoria ternatea TaxID=43366 RepID=A0AAN9I9N2_CLITE
MYDLQMSFTLTHHTNLNLTFNFYQCICMDCSHQVHEYLLVLFVCQVLKEEYEEFELKICLDQCYYFKKKHGKDIRKDNRVIGKLRRESERAKRALNNQHQVRVKIESLFDGVDFLNPSSELGLRS